MYLHCHNCHWQQDDFWDRTYNPLRSLLNWEDALLDRSPDEKFTKDAAFIEDHGDLDVRQTLIEHLGRTSRCIAGMTWRTMAEWQVAGKPGCPDCGNSLDMD